MNERENLSPVNDEMPSGKWWIGEVDASLINPNLSSGGGYSRVIATTEQMLSMNKLAYCMIRRGPFNSRDEIDGYCFVSDSFDSAQLGADAHAIILPSYIISMMKKGSITEPISFSSQAVKWWVCGMDGGVCQTEELPSLIAYGRRITDGPFADRDSAVYAFDVLWESR